MQRRTRRQLERFFLLTGIGCVAIWIFSIAGPAVFQDWESWAFDQKVQHSPATLRRYLIAKKDQIRAGFGTPPTPATKVAEPQRPSVELRRPEPAPKAPQTGTLLGRLEIPRLHLNSMVREGAGETTLAIALGHIPGTALPGQNGNVGVAGHRDRLFRGLKDIRTNDVIQFETLAGNYSYRVESTQIVTPQDVGVVKPGPQPELTLVTCYPFYYVGPAPKRFIVRARQLLQPTPAPNEPAQPKSVAPPPVVTSIRKPKPSTDRMPFWVSTNHSQQLAPGVSIGLMETNAADHRLKGWVWLSAEHRTIWLRDETPVRIYGALDGRTRLLVITSITPRSIAGYIAAPTS